MEYLRLRESREIGQNLQHYAHVDGILSFELMNNLKLEIPWLCRISDTYSAISCKLVSLIRDRYFLSRHRLEFNS